MRPFLLCLIALMTTACGGLISNAQEVEIGKGVDQQLEAEYRMVDSSDPVARWAKDLVARLSRSSGKHRNPQEFGGYKVEVIADNELVNAFAGPGGFTYLSTGLVLQAKTCAEITGVLGHELGHVTEKHSVEKIEGAFAAQTLASFFLGEGLTGQAAVTIFNFLQATKFSQEDEQEADSVGLEIAYDAGYNPYGLVEFFKKIKAMEKKAGGGGPQFLSSHPATASRISDVTKQIERKYGNKVNPSGTQTYECLGTSMTLAQVQARIKSGEMKVRAKAANKS